MAKFIVEPEFWELFPEGQVNILVLKGINNTVDETEDPYFEGILQEACQKAKVHFLKKCLVIILSFNNGDKPILSLKRKKELVLLLKLY